MNTRCETCRFWLGSKYDNWSGVCRRHAPVTVGDLKRGKWPTTARTDLCGDFERLPPTPEEEEIARAKEQAREEKFLKEVFP